MKKRRAIQLQALPGQSVEAVRRGAGRMVIHLFVKDTHGPFVEPHALHQACQDGIPVKGQLEAKPTRGRLACQSNALVAPVTRDGVTKVTLRTDDPRAVTCPACLKSDAYEEMMDAVAGTGVSPVTHNQ